VEVVVVVPHILVGQLVHLQMVADMVRLHRLVQLHQVLVVEVVLLLLVQVGVDQHQQLELGLAVDLLLKLENLFHIF
jgi:hypothetical protein